MLNAVGLSLAEVTLVTMLLHQLGPQLKLPRYMTIVES